MRNIENFPSAFGLSFVLHFGGNNFSQPFFFWYFAFGCFNQIYLHNNIVSFQITSVTIASVDQ